MTTSALPQVTATARRAAPVIDAAEHSGVISGEAAAYLRAACYATLELQSGAVAVPARVALYRREGLRVLAEARGGWEPDVAGWPVLDGAVGRLVRYLAGGELDAGQVAAWAALCAAVDAGAPHSVEADAERALSCLCESSRRPR
jgi:hypothetical protein